MSCSWVSKSFSQFLFLPSQYWSLKSRMSEVVSKLKITYHEFCCFCGFYQRKNCPHKGDQLTYTLCTLRRCPLDSDKAQWEVVFEGLSKHHPSKEASLDHFCLNIAFTDFWSATTRLMVEGCDIAFEFLQKRRSKHVEMTPGMATWVPSSMYSIWRTRCYWRSVLAAKILGSLCK